MPTNHQPFFREIVSTAIKAAGTVVALALVYPFVVTTIAHSLSSSAGR